MDKVFAFSVARKDTIIFVWKIVYLLFVIFLFLGSRSIYLVDDASLWFYKTGVWAGRAALVFFVITSLPGMARRFDIRHKFFSLLMIFRRYLGITTYLLALMHASFVRLVSLLAGFEPWFPRPLFEMFGTVALALLFPLFLTSNDRSVARLGVWWQRMHNLFYLIMWLIFAHAAIQRVSIWSVLIGMTGIAEIMSFVWARRSKV